MRNLKLAELEQKLEEAKKESTHYKKIAEKTGNLFLRETEELSKVILWRKQAEKALRESEERFRNVYETAPLAFVVWDINTLITDWNKKAEVLFGWTKEEVIGKSFYDFLIPEKDRHQVLNAVDRLLKNEFQNHSINENLTKDGKIITCEWNNSRLHDTDGNIIGAISLGLDITERKRMEKEKEKLQARLRQSQKIEAIGTLAGGIAHDFNNILGIILGNTELALDNLKEREPTLSNLEEIRKACLRAKDIVRQLLSFARKTDPKRHPIKLIAVVEDSLKFLRATIPTNINIRHDIQTNNDTILADSIQIHQVLINLCTNAFHAMQETGGFLDIKIENVILEEDNPASHPDLASGNYLKLTVSDTGHGINPELKDQIFDPYFTTKEIGKGTGMGLSVVHGIVKSHGGEISVDSEPKRGTTVRVYFRVVEEEAPVKETEIAEGLPVGTERILFVDDEESNVYVGRNRLERLGYKVETRMSPLDALKLFKAAPDQFDLLITDMTMPQMTGDQLVKEILKLRPDMPAILCSGFNEKIDEKKALEIGIRQYIEKPYDKRFMAKIIRKVLDEK